MTNSCREAIRRCRVREPFNGFSHLAGMLSALAGLLWLVAVSLGKPWHLVGFLIYGLSSGEIRRRALVGPERER
jgi:predicted membrane channel-forming protein YqfA (hemolysin III family)